MNISKLEHVTDSMIERLFAKGKEMCLPKGDLFLETSRHMIEALFGRYLSAIILREYVSIKSFVVEAQRIIDSMNIAIEEHPSFC